MEAIRNKITSPTPKWGEVYNANFVGTGSEQYGWRPAVIFQNNVGNTFSPNVIVLPMTTNLKRMDMPTHVIVRAKDTGMRRDSMVICENPVSISKEKLGGYITSIPDEDMARIAIAALLATAALDLIDCEMLWKVKQQSAKLK